MAVVPVRVPRRLWGPTPQVSEGDEGPRNPLDLECEALSRSLAAGGTWLGGIDGNHVQRCLNRRLDYDPALDENWGLWSWSRRSSQQLLPDIGAIDLQPEVWVEGARYDAARRSRDFKLVLPLRFASLKQQHRPLAEVCYLLGMGIVHVDGGRIA